MRRSIRRRSMGSAWILTPFPERGIVGMRIRAVPGRTPGIASAFFFAFLASLMARPFLSSGQEAAAQHIVAEGGRPGKRESLSASSSILYRAALSAPTTGRPARGP